MKQFEEETKDIEKWLYDNEYLFHECTTDSHHIIGTKRYHIELLMEYKKYLLNNEYSALTRELSELNEELYRFAQVVRQYVSSMGKSKAAWTAMENGLKYVEALKEKK